MKNNLTGENTEKEVLKNPYLIKDMDSFLTFYVNKDGQFNGKYNSTKKRLENLRNTLYKIDERIKDPIEYLYYLYYEKQLDLRSTSDELKELGHNFPHETLRNMFKVTFKWKLRSNYEETPGKKLKDIKKASLEGEGGLAEVNKSRVNETRLKIQEIIEKSSGGIFSLEKYNNIKFKIDKLSYIFFSFGIIKDDSIENFQEFLLKLKNNFGDYRIVNILLGIIEKLNINMNININMKEIYGWLNRNKS